MATKRTPQSFAQLNKLPRGWSVVRNSATLAVTDYEHVGIEIVNALNDKPDLQEKNRRLETERDALASALKELLDAGEGCAVSDDVMAMVRFGDAEEKARAALAALDKK